MSKIEQKCQKGIPGSNFGAKTKKKISRQKKNLRTKEKGMWARVCARVCVCACVCARARLRESVRASARVCVRVCVCASFLSYTPP